MTLQPRVMGAQTCFVSLIATAAVIAITCIVLRICVFHRDDPCLGRFPPEAFFTFQRRRRILLNVSKLSSSLRFSRDITACTCDFYVVTTVPLLALCTQNKRRDFHRMWIQRINAGVRQHGISYSRFINQAKIADVQLNRKVCMLSDEQLVDILCSYFVECAPRSRTISPRTASSGDYLCMLRNTCT